MQTVLSLQRRVKTITDTRFNRREFLRYAAQFGLGGWSAALALARPPQAQPATPPETQPATQPHFPKPWWWQTANNRARIIDVRSERALPNGAVDGLYIRQMLDHAIQRLTDTRRVTAGWRRILGNSERIVLKFNSVGGDLLATNAPLADVLLDALDEAGYPRKRVLVVEVAGEPAARGTRAVPKGWTGGIDVAGNPDQLAAYFDYADAVINVPLLKTHRIAGISGALKNLSHAIVRQPARYHANGCAPYVAHVIGNPKVSAKIKLNLVNALRLVVRNGPDPRPEDVIDYGGLLLGYDPVATDTVGLAILASERRRLGRTEHLLVPSLASAAELGVGRWRPGAVERLALKPEG